MNRVGIRRDQYQLLEIPSVFIVADVVGIDNVFFAGLSHWLVN